MCKHVSLFHSILAFYFQSFFKTTYRGVRPNPWLVLVENKSQCWDCCFPPHTISNRFDNSILIATYPKARVLICLNESLVLSLIYLISNHKKEIFTKKKYSLSSPFKKIFWLFFSKILRALSWGSEIVPFYNTYY